MFQPRVKLHFVERYCAPSDGWTVFVDIDASEEGRTGGERKSQTACETQRRMTQDGNLVRQEFARLGVHVGKRTTHWKRLQPKVAALPGDHDIIALNQGLRTALVVEAEGESSGQPETKVYKAIGQVVAGLSTGAMAGFRVVYGIVVFGDPVGEHLARCKRLADLGVFGLQLKSAAEDDLELFHPPEFSVLRRQQPTSSSDTIHGMAETPRQSPAAPGPTRLP